MFCPIKKKSNRKLAAGIFFTLEEDGEMEASVSSGGDLDELVSSNSDWSTRQTVRPIQSFASFVQTLCGLFTRWMCGRR